MRPRDLRHWHAEIIDLRKIWKIEQLEEAVNRSSVVRLVVLSGRNTHVDAAFLESRGDPFHFRTIGCRLLRNHDVTAVRQHASKSLEHSVRVAEDFRLELGIRLIQPPGQADSARNRINLGDGVTVIGQNEIGPNDERQIVAKFFASRELDEVFRFAGVEIARDPRWLFSFDAELVKLIARALENEQPMTKLLELGTKFLLDRKRVGRKQPILVGEQPLRWKRALIL